MTARFLVGSREFERRKLREFAASGEAAILCRQFPAQIRNAQGDDRSIDFVISTPAVDRYGDSIAAGGWKLANYLKNPVVLWMHDNTMLPVAKGSNVRIEANALKARATFTAAGLVKYNDTILWMLKQGFLSAVSVGFTPLKFKFSDDPKRGGGIDFIEQELLEFSIVTVPANPEALLDSQARAAREARNQIPDIPQGLTIQMARQRLDQLRG